MTEQRQSSAVQVEATLTKNATDSHPNSEVSSDGCRRLTVAHLFVWTLFCAINLLFYKRVYQIGDVRSDYQTAQAVFNGLTALIHGTAWTAAWVLGQRWLQTGFQQALRQREFEPGHWLVVSQVLYSMCLILVGGFISFPTLGEWSSPMYVAFSACLAIGLGAFAGYAARYQPARLWAIFFSMLSGTNLLRAAAYLLVVSGSYASYRRLFDGSAAMECLTALCLFLALGVDYLRGRRRDVIHYSGILLLLLEAAVSWIWYRLALSALQ